MDAQKKAKIMAQISECEICLHGIAVLYVATQAEQEEEVEGIKTALREHISSTHGAEVQWEDGSRWVVPVNEEIFREVFSLAVVNKGIKQSSKAWSK